MPKPYDPALGVSGQPYAAPAGESPPWGFDRYADPPFSSFFGGFESARPTQTTAGYNQLRPATEEQIVTEVTIKRLPYASSVSRIWVMHQRRWRWDVIRQRAVDGAHPGVRDSRVHLGADHGYAFTRLGAALAVMRRVS